MGNKHGKYDLSKRPDQVKMGCGTSSTPVKEFKPRQASPTFKQVENHADHNTQKETRIKSASSESSKKSSKSSKDGSRSSSASSHKKERVNSGKSSRASSAKSDRYRKESGSVDQERNIQTDSVPKDNDIVADSEPIETIDSKVTEVERTENQDDTVGTQDLRNTQDIIDDHDDKEFSDLDLDPISIPVINPNKQLPDYTLDDIVNNNTQKGRNNWFLYGRKVYSIDLFIPIIFQRVQQYLEMTNQDAYASADEILSGTTHYGSYPVYVARNNGVRKKEVVGVLRASQIGLLASMSREEYLARLKHCVDNVKSDLESEEDLSMYLVDYLEQLSRWLSVYPNVELEAPVDRTNVDPNQCEFPLPDKIRADSTVIRKWAKDWEPFDLSIDEEAAWSVIPLLNEDWGDVHQIFADIVAKREDDSLPEMDMEIDGEAAWNVIQLDIVKNDETTQEQEDIWNARATRKDLNDPERMRKRRKQLAGGFLARYDTKLKPEDMTEYLGWADRLEKHWKEFQELCETFVHRRHLSEESKVSHTKDLQPKQLEDKVEKDYQKSVTSRTQSASSSTSGTKSMSEKYREEQYDSQSNATDVESKTLSDKCDSETNLAHETVTDETKSLPDNIPPHDTMSLRSEHGPN